MFAKLKFWLLCAVLLASAPLAIRADDEPAEKKAKPAREDGDKRKEEWNKLSPEQREAKRAEIRIRLEKRICELRTKQTNSTITAQELRDLARSEQVLKRFETNAVPALAKPAK